MSDTIFQTAPMKPITLIEDIAYRVPFDVLEAVSPSVRKHERNLGWSLVWDGKKAGRHGNRLAQSLSVGGGEVKSAAGRVQANDLNLRSAAILCMVGREWTSGVPAPRVYGQALAVLDGEIDDDRVTILQNLNRNATTIRATYYQGEDSPVTLLHLRDDPDRGSSLRSFLHTASAKSAEILWPYQSDVGLIFSAQAPDRAALAAVSYMLTEAPELFNLEDLSNVSPRVDSPAMLIRRKQVEKATERFMLHDLRNAAFFGPSAFLPDSVLPVVRPVVAKASRDDALGTLKTKLTRSDGAFASRIRLVDSGRTIDKRLKKGRLIKLRRDRADVERELAMLESDLGHRHLLLVADSSGFQAVAEALRRIHSAEGAWYGTEYGFASFTEDGEPYHLLSFPPSASVALVGLDTVVSELAHERPSVHLFEADPTWQLKYADHSRIPVLVPAGRAISKLPHAWEADQMDQFLVNTVQDLADVKAPVAADSVAAIVFAEGGVDESGDGGKAGDTVQMIVIDKEVMQPISGHVLSWLNDVTLVQARSADRASVAAMAAAEREADMARRSAALYAAAEASIKDARNAALARSDKEIAQVAAAISGQIDTLMKLAEERSLELQRLEANTHNTLASYGSGRASAAAIEDAHKTLLKRASGAAAKSTSVSNKVTDALAEMRNRFEQDRTRATSAVTKMESDVNALRKRLDDIKW